MGNNNSEFQPKDEKHLLIIPIKRTLENKNTPTSWGVFFKQ
jgi:hypothetical protein